MVALSIGTRTLLGGAHHWWHHTRGVLRAWRWLFGRSPDWRETLAIVLHDVGYLGLPELDGPRGTFHPLRSARIVQVLAGDRAAELVRAHSITCCHLTGRQPSLLCWADKLATAMWILEDRDGYLRCVRRTGEIVEYRQVAATSGFCPDTATDEEWADRLGPHIYAKALRGAPSTAMSYLARLALYRLRVAERPTAANQAS